MITVVPLAAENCLRHSRAFCIPYESNLALTFLLIASQLGDSSNQGGVYQRGATPSGAAQQAEEAPKRA